MELWHLDYEKSVSTDPDRHLKIALAMDADAAAPLVAQAFDEGLYRKVALIDDAIPAHEVFYLTQNENDWIDAPPDGVIPVGRERRRSTSVGDALVTPVGHFALIGPGLTQFFPSNHQTP